jgi:hypothetical protein
VTLVLLAPTRRYAATNFGQAKRAAGGSAAICDSKLDIQLSKNPGSRCLGSRSSLKEYSNNSNNTIMSLSRRIHPEIPGGDTGSDGGSIPDGFSTT